MRRAFVVLAGSLVALSACKRVRQDLPSTAPSPEAAEVARGADAAPHAPPPAEEPLGWGTRPPKDGPLYPVVDGECSRGEVWPAGTTALFTMGGSTLGVLRDDGLDVSPEVTRASDPKHPFERPSAPARVVGSWPGPLLFYGDERGMGRTRSFDSTWLREPGGWSLVGSYREKGEPIYAEPALHRGFIVTARSAPESGALDAPWSASLIVSYPVDKGAPAIPALASLGRAGVVIHSLHATATSIHALGRAQEGSYRELIRTLEDGKVTEVQLPSGSARVVGTAGSALYLLAGPEAETPRKLLRLQGGKLGAVAAPLPAGAFFRGASVAPDGDVWLLTSKDAVVVVKGSGEVSETALPPPARPGPAEKIVYTPRSGARIAGADVADPYAIGETGALYHFADGRWTEVPLPRPPFATAGAYRAQALHVLAKGDPIVNAAYLEKGLGWRRPVGYRAVLRAKRPREVLRCNEPADELTGIADGVMPFPPIADDACTTPFVVLLRTGFALSSSYPRFGHDPQGGYPSLRAALEDVPALGATVDLVELRSGEQRYLGARVPSVEVGRALARAVAEKVKHELFSTRPEVVCGTPPKVERALRVDVASGKVVADAGVTP